MRRNSDKLRELRVAGQKGAGVLNNAGYTLLEMIVVVAILAIGLAIVSYSIGTIFSLEMRQCVSVLDSELGKEKVACMTRVGEVYMRLYKTSDGIYIDKYENDALDGHSAVPNEHIKVGTVKVSIRYYVDSDTEGALLDENGIVISFNKNNGSFKNISQSWLMFDSAHSVAGEYYTKLVLSGGSNSRTIVLWPDTGKFSVSG